MVLKHSYHGVINGNIRMNKYWIASEKRNTYGVVPHTTYPNPG